MVYPPVPKESLNIVAFDLDGTLAEDTWPQSHVGAVIPEGEKMLRHYAELGFACIIYTARPKSHEQAIWNWLFQWELEDLVYDVICGKPRAALYVDDRGYRFEPTKKTVYSHKDKCCLTKTGVCSCRE